jgi:hypothetical protein
VQDEISLAVVDALKVTLLGDAFVDKRKKVSVDAYEQYLQARYFLDHVNSDNLHKAITALDKAVEIDPLSNDLHDDPRWPDHMQALGPAD